MLAEQFHAAASAARNTAAVDEIARLTWRAHAEGQLVDAEAEAVSEALRARRATFATPDAPHRPRGLPLAFPGAPGALDRLTAKPRSSGAGAKP